MAICLCERRKKMKYQFILNGKVISAKELYEMDLSFYIFDLDDLLQGKVVELDSFVSENSFDKLQLVEVE